MLYFGFIYDSIGELEKRRKREMKKQKRKAKQWKKFPKKKAKSTNSETGEESGDKEEEKKVQKPVPNYFVAIQITDEKVKSLLLRIYDIHRLWVICILQNLVFFYF